MKRNVMKSSLFAAMVLLTFACSQTSEMGEGATAATGNQADYEELYNKTLAEYKKLDEQGGAWRDTEETIEKAQESAKKSDYAAAVKLLKQASDETQLAMKQLGDQKNARPTLF